MDTPTERIERAASLLLKTVADDWQCWYSRDGSAEVVMRILTAAFPELMSDPPTHWIAPVEATKGTT